MLVVISVCKVQGYLWFVIDIFKNAILGQVGFGEGFDCNFFKVVLFLVVTSNYKEIYQKLLWLSNYGLIAILKSLS